METINDDDKKGYIDLHGTNQDKEDVISLADMPNKENFQAQINDEGPKKRMKDLDIPTGMNKNTLKKLIIELENNALLTTSAKENEGWRFFSQRDELIIIRTCRYFLSGLAMQDAVSKIVKDVFNQKSIPRLNHAPDFDMSEFLSAVAKNQQQMNEIQAQLIDSQKLLIKEVSELKEQALLSLEDKQDSKILLDEKEVQLQRVIIERDELKKQVETLQESSNKKKPFWKRK